MAARRTDLTIGPARVDRRTKNLVRRLQPGDIAVIDHEDLDRVAAEALIEARAGAVVNAAKSVSGRYPNLGPLLVVAAGIPLVDGVGPDVLDVGEGEVLRVEDDAVWAGDECVGKGERQTIDSLEEAIAEAKATIGAELSRFAENTIEYLQQEHHLLTDAPDLPELETDFRGRHVLVVVRGHDYREDLKALAGYVREVRPVLVAVDGGADALLEAGYRPDVIVGDFDSVSTAALRSGAELVVHGYPEGEAPGAERLAELGLRHHLAEAHGTSEDLALVLAYEKGAELIVAVGTHSSLVDFLDKGRAGMASTFLVRLKVGPILVDAKGVNRLYETRLRKRDLGLLVVSALLTMVIVTAASDSLQLFFQSLWKTIADAWPG